MERDDWIGAIGIVLIIVLLIGSVALFASVSQTP